MSIGDKLGKARRIVESYIVGTTGNQAEVNSDGQLHTVMRGKVDTGNSTEDNLAGGATFTGTSVDTLDFAAVTIVVYSDKASATDGMVVQFSDDETDWHDGETYTILAGATKFFTPTMQNQYMRVVYTNGADATTDFHIHTTLRKSSIKPSSHNIEDPIVDQDDAELVKAVITGKKASGTYDNVSLTNGGNMKVSIEEYESGASPVRTDLEGNGYVTIGTTEVELTYTGTTNTVHLESKTSNTGTIWIGKTGVTNTGGNALASIEPGEALDIKYDDSTNALYAISDTAAQSLLKGALL